MQNNILEISKRAAKGGRVPIKIALLKIHEDINEVNRNGLHWDETFVTNAMESAISMPICAEFVDEDKSVPLGHGLTGTIVDENGISEPVFENSETVGVIESVAIETINNGESDIKALVGNGVLFNHRYPALVKWVRENYATNTVDTSIEIMGKPENQNKIIYLEEQPTEEYRTPSDFLFSGTAILSLSPADENAVVLEVAQKKEQNKEDTEQMEFNMDEIKLVIQNTISECNNKDTELNSKITELNSVVAQKDSELAEKDEKIVELNATIEQVKKALADLEIEREAYWAERDALQKELGELKAKARLGELNAAIKDFSEDERKFAESEINSFNEKPLEGDINAIVSKIYTGIGMASKNAEAEKVAELNSKKEEMTKIEDIFSEMCSEEIKDEKIEDINIF